MCRGAGERLRARVHYVARSERSTSRVSGVCGGDVPTLSAHGCSITTMGHCDSPRADNTQLFSHPCHAFTIRVPLHGSTMSPPPPCPLLPTLWTDIHPRLVGVHCQ